MILSKTFLRYSDSKEGNSNAIFNEIHELEEEWIKVCIFILRAAAASLGSHYLVDMQGHINNTEGFLHVILQKSSNSRMESQLPFYKLDFSPK